MAQPDTVSGAGAGNASPTTKPRGRRKTRVGVVVSDKMQKTVVVEVERLTAHPRYHKVVRRSQRLKAHDEKNEARVGDRVLLMETRPLSKEKRWRVVQILERGQGSD
ncbi:MAG TPA: 30S ribosomal protein S17 [Firmicutes bacterium]|nr:30S ribosomal protein S17 [Bacillota bacterium]